MTKFEFTSLFARYPHLIAEMQRSFSSHEFILRLAQQNQADYIEALHAYRDTNPFQVVHGIAF
jgi:hypothetical protein